MPFLLAQGYIQPFHAEILRPCVFTAKNISPKHEINEGLGPIRPKLKAKAMKNHGPLVGLPWLGAPTLMLPHSEAHAYALVEAGAVRGAGVNKTGHM